MGKSAPKAPDPKETAAAQTGTNVTTAIANGYLGNINQSTPDGTLKYTYGDYKTVKDPTTGTSFQVPTTTVTQELSPAQAAIKKQNDAASLNLATTAANQASRIDGLLGQPIDLSKAPDAADPTKLGLPSYQTFAGGPQLQTSVGNTGTIQNTVANAGDITKSYDVDFDTSKYEDAFMQRLNPQLAQSREALETKLANQGLQPGSEAYNRAIDAASRQENDAHAVAILNAGQEQSRLAGLAQSQAGFQNAAQAQQYSQNANNATFANSAQQQGYQQAAANAQLANSANQQMYTNGMSATAANNSLQDQTFNAQQAKMNAENQARATYLNEQYAKRNQPINEISGLLSGGQVTTPQFVPTQGQQIANVDYSGLVQDKYANDVARYNASQAGVGSVLGGLAGLFSLSDKDAKKDIEKVGGLYAYRYKGESKDAPKRIGVMAQEVEKIRPDAVRKGQDGLRRVNYGALFNAGITV